MTNLIKLNLARNCLKYIIKAYGIKEIFIPYYICPVIWISARQANCKVKFYHIDKNFMPTKDFPQNSYILYVNYYGLCSENCNLLSKKYKNIIIDNSQSFYSKPQGLASFNSLRKFFAVQNGAYLFTNKIVDIPLAQDNLNLQPQIFHKNTEEFIKNELTLNKENSIKTISQTVEKSIDNINFEADINQRLQLYEKYDRIFHKYNKINLKASKSNIPYCYPLNPSTEDLGKSLAEKFILLRLWKDLPKSFCENEYFNSIIALPLNDLQYAQNIINYFK